MSSDYDCAGYHRYLADLRSGVDMTNEPYRAMRSMNPDSLHGQYQHPGHPQTWHAAEQEIV